MYKYFVNMLPLGNNKFYGMLFSIDDDANYGEKPEIGIYSFENSECDINMGTVMPVNFDNNLLSFADDAYDSGFEIHTFSLNKVATMGGYRGILRRVRIYRSTREISNSILLLQDLDNHLDKELSEKLLDKFARRYTQKCDSYINLDKAINELSGGKEYYETDRCMAKEEFIALLLAIVSYYTTSVHYIGSSIGELVKHKVLHSNNLVESKAYEYIKLLESFPKANKNSNTMFIEDTHYFDKEVVLNDN